jgi:hypothetical protein
MTKTFNKKRRLLKIFILVLAILTVLPFSTYLISYQPQADSQLAYEDAEEFNQHYGFIQNDATVGVIYYPGGLVHPKAYARFAKALAMSTQYSVFVTSPLFHLAITQISLADQVMSQHPSIDRWLIGGHSLGGTSAAFYTIEHIDKITGLFFLASYTTEQANFSLTNLPVISMVGSEDSVLNQTTYLAHQQYLPTNHVEVIIEGGNHSQFADYGPQRGDGEATINGVEQEALVVNALTNWFDQLILK